MDGWRGTLASRIVQCDGCGVVVDSGHLLGNPRRIARELGWSCPSRDLAYYYDTEDVYPDLCPSCFSLAAPAKCPGTSGEK